MNTKANQETVDFLISTISKAVDIRMTLGTLKMTRMITEDEFASLSSALSQYVRVVQDVKQEYGPMEKWEIRKIQRMYK